MRVECDEKTKGIMDTEERYEIAEEDYTANGVSQRSLLRSKTAELRRPAVA